MRKNTPISVYITVYVGWILGFVILATLPFDIYTSSVFKPENPTDRMLFYRDFIQWNWKILYILTFMLTWFVFPFLMAYVIRGEFTRCRRLWKATLSNIVSYVIYLIFIAILIPVVFLLINKNRARKDRVSIFDV